MRARVFFTFITIFLAVPCAIAAESALYDDRECSIIADRLATAVPGLKFRKLQKINDGKDASIIFFTHPNAQEVSIGCPVEGISKEPDINVDWKDSFPPRGYFDLVAQMAAVILPMSPDKIRANVVKCQEGARAAEDQTNDVDGDDGMRYECSSFGGSSQVTVLKHDGSSK